MKYNFTGKSVLVTGSSSGIGEAIAKLFSQYGANVTVTGRNADNVARVAAACYQISPYKIRVYCPLSFKESICYLFFSSPKK